ncbi:hypothetical protein C4587_02430 [Candidatus Parcubacteria bacterium]|nr:MAG: hypothetical protein C4587_02430 [Candidatus Parcubacteria bacterium]
MRSRFVAFLLLTALAAEVQLLFSELIGFPLNFPLIVLLLAGLFGTLLEVLVLAGISMLILGWQPAPGPEVIVFLLVPLLVPVRRFFPWHGWVSSGIIVFAGLIAFFSVSNPGFVSANIPAIAGSGLAGAVIGVVLFQTLSLAYEEP